MEAGKDVYLEKPFAHTIDEGFAIIEAVRHTGRVLQVGTQYGQEIRLISNEIEDALVIFHTYEEINRLALKDASISEALDRDALFWNTQMYCLQCSLFIILSGIFDTSPNAHTIHTVVNATLGNAQFFSRDALTARKTGVGSKPTWLDAFMANAWIPESVQELRHLKKAVATCAKRFDETYRPIRNSIFAHRLMDNDQASVGLFGGTSRDELAIVLDSLHDVITAIENLFLNGTEPKLGESDFREHNQKIRDGVSALLARLPDRSLEK